MARTKQDPLTQHTPWGKPQATSASGLLIKCAMSYPSDSGLPFWWLALVLSKHQLEHTHMRGSRVLHVICSNLLVLVKSELGVQVLPAQS